METEWVAYQCKCCRGKKKLPDSEIDCPVCGATGEMWNEVAVDE